jgi:hypothetical protein
MSLKMQYLSLYEGSMKGIWRDGPYTEDFERHIRVIEGPGSGAFLLFESVRGT